MTPIAGFVDEMIAKADCTKRQDCQGFTGFRDIDELTNGMKKGGLILLAARPGVGKSTLASNIAGNMAVDCRRRVAFFCMEMGGALFAQSLVCSRSHVKGSALRNNKLTSAEKDRVAATAQIVKDAPLFVEERRDWDVAELTRTVREMNSEQKLDLVIVDYLQLVMSDKGETRIYHTKDIENGPWTLITLKGLYHDPSLFFDDDGKAYIVYGNRKSALPHSRRILSGFWTGAIRARTGTRTNVWPNSMWRRRKFF